MTIYYFEIGMNRYAFKNYKDAISKAMEPVNTNWYGGSVLHEYTDRGNLVAEVYLLDNEDTKVMGEISIYSIELQ